MKRHAIPQNIMDIEFKLFGSLSIRQFGLLSVNVIFALFFYISGIPDVLKWPIIVFFVSLGFAMALITVNGLPFTTWFGNFLLAVLTSQRRIWKKKSSTPDILRGSYRAEGKYTTHKISSAHKAVREMPLLKSEALLASRKVDKVEENELLILNEHLKKNYSDVDLKRLKKNEIRRPKSTLSEYIGIPILSKSGQNLAGDTLVNNKNLIGIDTGKDIKTTLLERNTTINRPFKSQNIINKPINNNIDSKSEKHVNHITDLKSTKIKEDLISPGMGKLYSKLSKETKPAAMINNETKQVITTQNKGDVAMGSNKTLDRPKDDLPRNAGSPQRTNMIRGIVMTTSGRSIQGVTIEIKDNKGFPLRKVLTDKLGQFSIQTSLPNGEYIMDFDKRGKKFTDYKIKLNGQVLPILEFKALDVNA